MLTVDRKSLNDDQDILIITENGNEIASKIGNKEERIELTHKVTFISIPNEEIFVTLNSINNYVSTK